MRMQPTKNLHNFFQTLQIFIFIIMEKKIYLNVIDSIICLMSSTENLAGQQESPK